MFDEEVIPKESEHVLTITQIYYLEIFEKKISISVLIQIVKLLLDITTVKIYSLSMDERIVKEFIVHYTNKITKVYFEEVSDEQELDFLFIFCPYMKYFKIGFINTMDVQSFLRTIFKKINRSLYFHIPTADDQIIENIEKMIKYDKLLFHFTVKRIVDTVYLQWE